MSLCIKNRQRNLNGLLVIFFHQLFEHPFTADDPLENNANFSNEETNSSILGGLNV